MKNGIYENMSIEDYHGNDTHLSSTALRMAKSSLKSMEYYLTHEQERKTCFDFGNAFEIALVMGNDAFHNNVIVFDKEDRPEKTKGITSKINQAWKKSILEGGKYVIEKTGKESIETLEGMHIACNDFTIQQMLKNADYQTSLFWKDEKSGLNLKTRPDLLKPSKHCLIDVKTALDGSPEGFSKAMVNNNLPLQACLQIKGAIASGLMKSVEQYYWLVVEKTAPYHATLYSFDKEDIKMCMEELDLILAKIAHAVKTNNFPGYKQQADNKHGILTAVLPTWYKLAS